MKKFYFLLIALLCSATMAFAYDAEIDGIYYNLDTENKTAEVTHDGIVGDYNCSGYTQSEIVIPEIITYNDVKYTVTSIGEYAIGCYNSGNQNINSISIPKTIIFIGKGAFLNCHNLSTVYISDVSAWCKIEFDPETISANPLYYADTLYLNDEIVTTLVIPEGVDSLKRDVFISAPISSFVFPESIVYIDESAFENCEGFDNWLESQSDGCVYIGKILYRFKGDFPIGITCEIKQGTTQIRKFAFEGCSFLTSITIPNSVSSIGRYAFEGCSSLTSIQWNVTKYSDFDYSSNPFGGCEQITSFTFGDNVEHIPAYLCYGMSKLTSITIPNSVTSIGDYAFYECSSLTSISIPNSVTTIGESTFSRCSSLTSITIPNSVTSIGESAFYNCSSLTSITIPNSVTEIRDEVFSGCIGLTSIEIPNSVTEIGYEAFSGCIGLTSIEIPNSVIYLGDMAFANCYSLRYAKLGKGFRTNNYEDEDEPYSYLGENLFYFEEGYYWVGEGENEERVWKSSPLDTLICEFGDDVYFHEDYEYHPFATTKNLRYFQGPAKLVNLIKEEFQTQFSNKLTEVHITDGELDENGFNYINRSKKSLHTIDLAGTTNTAINDLAFYDCYKLENLMLPSNLETIGFKAVAECYQLKEINIPASMVEINDAAFENCRSIKSITFGGQAEAKSFASRMNRAVADGDVALQRIGNWAFYNCHALENLVIPEGVTEVGDAAFYGCTYLDSLALPSTTQRIGDNCFALCSRMKQINVNAIEPPTIFAKTFFDVNRNIPVIVPEGAREAYANDEYWGEFINVVESEDTETQIENAKNANVAIYSVGGVLYVDGLSADYQVFDVNGRLIYTGRDTQLQLPRGVYMIAVGGEVEKVVI